MELAVDVAFEAAGAGCAVTGEQLLMDSQRLTEDSRAGEASGLKLNLSVRTMPPKPTIGGALNMRYEPQE